LPKLLCFDVVQQVLETYTISASFSKSFVVDCSLSHLTAYILYDSSTAILTLEIQSSTRRMMVTVTVVRVETSTQCGVVVRYIEIQCVSKKPDRYD